MALWSEVSLLSLEFFNERIRSHSGSLPIAPHDEITRKLAMLIEGECGAEGIDRAAGLSLRFALRILLAFAFYSLNFIQDIFETGR